VAFAPNQPLLATIGVDGIVGLWDVSSLVGQNEEMKHACSITGGGLSPAKWARNAPGLLYVDVCG
jgi:hypothetical protein